MVIFAAQRSQSQKCSSLRGARSLMLGSIPMASFRLLLADEPDAVLATWQGTYGGWIYLLGPDGDIVLSQADNQVRFLNLCYGQHRVSLSHARALFVAGRGT